MVVRNTVKNRHLKDKGLDILNDDFIDIGISNEAKELSSENRGTSS